MGFFQHFMKFFQNLRKREIFQLARYRIDGPERKTRDAVAYLFRGFVFIGFVRPPKYLVVLILWIIVGNIPAAVYMPLGFFVTFLTRFDEFTTSEFLTSLQIAVNIFGCLIKLTVYFFLHDKLIAATKYMDRLDLRISEPEDKEEIKKVVAFSNRTHMMFLTLYLSYGLMTFLTSILNGKPPYQLYNPLWEWSDNSLSFYLQLSLEYYLIDVHCYQQTILDSYPVMYIAILRAHIHILARRISKLGEDSKLNNDDRYEALVQCVLDHKNIMGLYNDFAPVLSGTMFIQFMIIGIVLGITTIHIVVFADFLTTVSSIIYVIALLAETFPCSFLANCLMDDSDSISLAIFHSDWPNEDPRYRRIISYFIQNTQQTLILTAMKIFPITMNSNINVVKFAFSVYTLIKQMDFGLNIKGATRG